MNGENAILPHESGKGPFYPGVPFLVDLQSFNPRTEWKTGRSLEGEVESETMRFEHAQRMTTKVQQQARQKVQGSQEGKKFPRNINGV